MLPRVFTFVFIAYAMLSAQQQQATRQTSQLPSSGTLVLKSEVAGTVEIDGSAAGKVNTDQILRFTLGPGQHFVTLRDASGVKLGEKVVSILTGVTTAETLPAGTAAPPQAPAVASSATGVQTNKLEPLTAQQKAYILLALGRTQEAKDIFAMLGDGPQQKLAQDAIDRARKSPASGHQGASFILYRMGQYQSALQEEELHLKEVLARA